MEREHIVIHESRRENMGTNGCSNSFNDVNVINVLRRAIVQGDQDAQVWVQQRLGKVVCGWLHHHPSKEAACRLESEEYYVAGAFERFWQLTIDQQFNTLATALPYLLVSLHGAILDRLRAASRPEKVPLPQPGLPRELLIENAASGIEIWELLQRILLDAREQRLAYLLFHCGLAPQEIVQYRPQEFGDIAEVYHLRRKVIERISHCEDLKRYYV